MDEIEHSKIVLVADHAPDIGWYVEVNLDNVAARFVPMIGGPPLPAESPAYSLLIELRKYIALNLGTKNGQFRGAVIIPEFEGRELVEGINGPNIWQRTTSSPHRRPYFEARGRFWWFYPSCGSDLDDLVVQPLISLMTVIPDVDRLDLHMTWGYDHDDLVITSDDKSLPSILTNFSAEQHVGIKIQTAEPGVASFIADLAQKWLP